jgi:hypothetical protein
MAEKPGMPIEALAAAQAKAWSGVSCPSATAESFAAALAGVVAGFERLHGELQFEEEPSSFEAALDETKERAP